MGAWTNKLKSFLGISVELNDEFFETLCDLLVEGDFGAALALKTSEILEARCKKEKIKTASGAKELLGTMLKEYLISVQSSEPFFCEPFFKDAPSILNVILLLGVNGVGKTTSAAKLAALYQNKFKDAKPLLAAADTFRAAAIDQLKIHGERLGIRVVAHKQNADPAAVVHDALAASLQGGYNPLIADTAGRMHTKKALVDELAKISRVIQRFDAVNGGEDTAIKLIYKKLLVLDSTTGSNAVSQAEVFNEAIKLDGVILTKADSSARGGVVFPLAINFKLPVLFVCSGEKYEHIEEFKPQSYVDSFLG